MNFLAELSNQFTPWITTTLGVWHTIISYMIGAISIIFLFLSFQMKDRKKILIINAIGSFGWTLYFVFQGDFTSGLIGIVALIRTLIFSMRDKHAWAKSIIWLFVFLGLNVFFTCLSFSSPKDLFSLFAGIMSTISFFMLKERHVRLCSLACYLLWMGNSLSKGYWIALVSDVVTTTSVIIGIIRYNKKQKLTNTNDPTLNQVASTEVATDSQTEQN